MKKGDCFLCPGEKCRTLYYITDVKGSKCWALSIFVNQNTVQAMDWIQEYDADLPDDIINLPPSMYDTIKQVMQECMADMHKTLQEEALRVDFDIEVGALYTDGCSIHRVTEMKDDEFGHTKWHYKLFRIDTENISMNWGGSSPADSYKNHILPITEDTLEKVKARFEILLSNIAQHLGQ